MKELRVEHVDWVGFKQRDCPECQKKIYIDTKRLENNVKIKCYQCNKFFKIKL